MKKQFLFAALIAAAAVSCNKKEETGAITTQETTTATPETTTTTTVTPVDSTTAVAQTQTATTQDKTTTTKTTTGEVETFVSNDGKTTFSVIFDNENQTAAVKNETTGKTYDMKSVTSGSGAKFADKDGNFFWEHQGEFTFGKGDKDEIEGKKK